MNIRSSTSSVTLSLAAIFLLSGCAQLNTAANSSINSLAKGVNKLTAKDSNQSISDKSSCDDYIAGKVLGTGVGIGVGATAGYYLGGKNGALLGGALGAGAGYLIGSAVDERRKELCKLARETKTPMLLGDIKAEDIDGGMSMGVEADVVALPDVKFETGSAELTSEQTAILKKFAQIYAKTEKNGKILIVGNTDDTGDEARNQKLSEARAKTIANVFKSQGINESNLYYQGAGASMPIASNATKEGKNINRRVEIAVFKSEDQLVQAVQSRTPNPEFFSKKESYEKEETKPEQKKVKAQKIADAKSVKVENKSDNKVAQKASSKKTVSPANKSSNLLYSSVIDFGGSDSKTTAPLGAKIGSPKKAVSWLDNFSFSTPAYADDENVNYRKSCKDDFSKPQYGASSIKKLKDGGNVKYTTGNYYNGLYNTAWVSEDVNGNFVSMMPMAILKEGAKPVAVPELKVWKDYATNKKDQADISVPNNVNTYMGDKGLLLRFYPSQKNDSIICSDMFVSADGKTGLEQIYYRKDGKVYMRETQTKKVTQQ
jgi:outer membrane protein OmpA-like peptidoglycan-associated protein